MPVQGKSSGEEVNFLKNIPKEKLQKIVLVGVLTVIGVAALCIGYVQGRLSSLMEGRKRVAELTQQLREIDAAQGRAAYNQPVRERESKFVETQQATMITGDPFLVGDREISLLAESHPVRVLGLRSVGKLPKDPKATYETS